MPNLLRPGQFGLGRQQGDRPANAKHKTVGRAIGFLGLAALVAVAASCLPRGTGSTSTYASIPVEDSSTTSANSSPSLVNAAVTTTPDGSTASSLPEIRLASESTPADSTTEPAEAEQELAPTPPAFPDRVWLVSDPEQLAQSDLGYQPGEPVIIAIGDLRALPAEAREMITYASEVKMGPDLGEDAHWQLETIRRGHQIPGGGLLMFESGFERRLVAIYGHPSTSGLGLLGEQGPEAGVERLRSLSQGYGADGSLILPTYEIITTVASGSAGSDGDYSAMTARDVIRPWIETAAANNMYVVLDLQPGRTDFLTQARVYEEFLRLPHVGLALDPEWRLKPDQVHLEQIGTVDGAEINQVVQWLAAIVREEALPQKLLIVHQFATSMITNRQIIDTPPELAVMIHMDGQGSSRAKYASWNTLTSPPDAEQFYWGWKNFIDEDFTPFTPDQVLELNPNPKFVSFQ